MGFDSRQGQIFVSSPSISPNLASKELRGIKRPESGADHPPENSAEIKSA